MTELPRLTEESLPEGPFELFAAWLGDAEASGMTDPNAMTLATAGADGRPSARTVLLRGVGDDGFRFFTNRTSLKGRQLGENPRAQLLFFWREIGRQILVHGSVD
ncbi:MAG: pyridoxamine 5'-phosphate oxidase family protein, partial [Solirubrobacteraceae bacterium]|nr:pyridoxamine 5'-phosphate oxidase family protein [Solirubrobacteraceae bacterium]